MANEEQLAILKQGVDVWNKWREANPYAIIDLKDAYLTTTRLSGANLSGAKLSRATLRTADLSEADLSKADLIAADLSGAYLNVAKVFDSDLRGANLSAADLGEADFGGANLSGTNLKIAHLGKADLSGANLTRADLSGANLIESELSEADLTEANLSGAKLRAAYLWGAYLWGAKLVRADVSDAMISNTIFGNLDLREVIGLENAVYGGPSSISIDTFALSKGKIPEVFLKGCGLNDADIEYSKLSNPDLSNDEINKILYKIYDVRATQALQISPLFISYSHSDRTFIDKLESKLNTKGVRFWRDIHDLKAGRTERQIDQAISQDRTVLLVLSEHSLKSDWVEHEVRKAREIAKNAGRDTLCPVALDDSWKKSPWPQRVMEQIMEYNILDFSEWQDDSKFDAMFRKLVDGLELFYKR